MMRLTFGAKQVNSMMIMILMTAFVAISSAAVNGWQHDGDSNTVLSEGDNCRLRNGDPGVCIRIESCAPLIDGLRKKTIQYSSLVRCSFIGITEVICCPQSGTGTATTTGRSTNSRNPCLELDSKFQETNNENCASYDGKPTDSTTHQIDIRFGTVTPITTTTVETVLNRNENERPSQAACRRYKEFNNPNTLTFHILDGVPVEPGDYPHMGGLIYPFGGGDDVDLRCGSSLISERYVLTAAHCVNDALALPTLVRFGVVVWNSTEDGIIPVDVEIENITLHTDYVSHLNYHDIALIRLRRDVAFTPFIRPACLYSDLSDVDSSIKLVVTGWGVTNVDTKARSTVLLMTNVTTVALRNCNATHETNGFTRRYRAGLNDGQYCAFDPEFKKDACQADSGGPLQLVENKESTIVGVVSFGNSCATSIPSVYARVAFYLNWIESIVWPS